MWREAGEVDRSEQRFSGHEPDRGRGAEQYGDADVRPARPDRVAAISAKASIRSYALTHDVRGIWGGLTDEDRKASRARAHLPEPRSVTDELDDLVRRWRSAVMASSGGQE
jgi:hypothetical protein